MANLQTRVNVLLLSGIPVTASGTSMYISGIPTLSKIGDTSTGVFTFGRVISSSNYSSAIKTLTGQYTLTTGDSTIIFSGSNLTGTLPSASTASGYYFDVKNIFGSVILSGAAGQAVEGLSGYTIPLNEAIRVQSDGGVWRILSKSATGSFITTAQTGVYLTGVGTLGAGSGLFSSISNNAAQLRSLVTGSGIIILGDANTLTTHTTMGIQFKSGLQANITLAVANSYSGIVSGNVGPGTWLVTAMLNARSTGNSAMRVSAKLWSGLGAFAAGEEDALAGGAAVTGHVCITLTNIFSTTGTTTPLVLSAASTFAGTVVLTGVQDNGLGTDTVGACTQISAVRII